MSCGSDTTGRGPTVVPDDDDGGSNEHLCIDTDEDGYGKYCNRGSDCDDNDPAVTDECRRCILPTKGCACEPGRTPVSCEPPILHVDGGILVCKEGTRYCRSGTWGDCETIDQYVFQAQ
jgi:hypothetical protein